MRVIFDRIAVVFAAGAFGGLVNSVALWLGGAYGITAALDVAIAPALTPAWLYPRIVWGGIWAALFLLPLARPGYWLRALLYGLGPTALQLFWVFPAKTPHGMMGLGLGDLTPLVVFIVNAIWALATALMLRWMGRA